MTDAVHDTNERTAPIIGMPSTIRRLAWLHAANDFTLDFLTPLLPAVVPVAWLGLMEGAADAVAQVLKLVVGRASDASGRRAFWVQAGYGTNAIARPLVAICMALAWPLAIVACRIMDRFGKGLRGSASDALVADWIDAGRRARAYAYLRTMDHVGATAGAGCAAAVCWALSLDFSKRMDLTWVIVALLLPMALMLWWCRGLRDHPQAALRIRAATGWWPRSGKLRLPLIAIGFASLGAKLAPLLVIVHIAGIPAGSEPALSGGGWPLWAVCLAWGALALVQAGASSLAGVLTDRMGPRLFLQGGWLITAALLATLCFAKGGLLIGVGVGWAAIAGISDGAEKTWLADITPKEERALAFGALGVVIAAAMLISSSAVGYGLSFIGPRIFLLPAGGLAIACLLLTLRPRTSADQHS
jgi:MFS family permease